MLTFMQCRANPSRFLKEKNPPKGQNASAAEPTPTDPKMEIVVRSASAMSRTYADKLAESGLQQFIFRRTSERM